MVSQLLQVQREAQIIDFIVNLLSMMPKSCNDVYFLSSEQFQQVCSHKDILTISLVNLRIEFYQCANQRLDSMFRMKSTVE